MKENKLGVHEINIYLGAHGKKFWARLRKKFGRAKLMKGGLTGFVMEGRAKLLRGGSHN